MVCPICHWWGYFELLGSYWIVFCIYFLFQRLLLWGLHQAYCQVHSSCFLLALIWFHSCLLVAYFILWFIVFCAFAPFFKLFLLCGWWFVCCFHLLALPGRGSKWLAMYPVLSIGFVRVVPFSATVSYWGITLDLKTFLAVFQQDSQFIPLFCSNFGLFCLLCLFPLFYRYSD